MDDYENPIIAKTEKILHRLNEIDDKFSSLEDELMELKWELDDIKNSISPRIISESVQSPEEIKPKIKHPINTTKNNKLATSSK